MRSLRDDVLTIVRVIAETPDAHEEEIVSSLRSFGYQLLVTAAGRFNVALAANGAVATASSTATGSGFSTTGAINGNNRGL